MKKLGFRPTKNSGSGWIEKEDGISESCLCQLKSTDKNSISVKVKDLATLVHNSIISHKIPVFAVQFLQTNETWLLVRPEDLKDLKEIAEGNSVQKKDLESVFLIDTEEKICYNSDMQIDSNKEMHYLKSDLKARIRFTQQKEKEMKEAKKRRKKN